MGLVRARTRGRHTADMHLYIIDAHPRAPNPTIFDPTTPQAHTVGSVLFPQLPTAGGEIYLLAGVLRRRAIATEATGGGWRVAASCTALDR